MDPVGKVTGFYLLPESMDESWRMRMGLDNNLPRRRSTEESSSDRLMRRSVFGLNYNITTTITTTSNNNSSSSDQTLLIDPDNFKDVFGGPPRSVISRQFSSDFITGGGGNNRSTSSSSNNTFYQEIFQSSEFVAQAKRGKKLPVFRIPTKNGSIIGGGGEERNGRGGFRRRGEDGFFDDIFGSDDDRNRSRSQSSTMKTNSKTKSKSKSISNSSSVLSSEELSPLRPSIAEDVFFTSFSSNLRPINVPGRRNSSSMHSREEQQQQQQQHQQKQQQQQQQQQRRGVSTSDIPWIHPPFTDQQHHHQFIEHDLNHENYRSSSSHFGFSKSISSPETISIEPNSYRSIKLSLDDLDPDSPVSIVSLHRDLETSFNQNKASHEQEEEEEDDDDDEIMSSYVIEINSNNKKDTSGEAVGIEEAIAWAKERFQAQMLEAFEAGNQKYGMRLGAKEPTAEKQG